MQDSQRKFVADDSFFAGDTDPDQQQQKIQEEKSSYEPSYYSEED